MTDDRPLLPPPPPDEEPGNGASRARPLAAEVVRVERVVPDPRVPGLTAEAAAKPQRRKRQLAPDRDPWERQPRETEQAWEAFVLYRDWDPERDGVPVGRKQRARSLAAVAQVLGKSVKLLERWSYAWSWQDRIAEYERERDRARRDVLEKDRLAFLKRQRDIGTALSAAATLRLLGDPDLRITELSPNDLEPIDIVRFLLAGAKLERAGLEMPPLTVVAARIRPGGSGEGEQATGGLIDLLGVVLGEIERGALTDDSTGPVGDGS